jgi:hypothetical protein
VGLTSVNISHPAGDPKALLGVARTSWSRSPIFCFRFLLSWKDSAHPQRICPEDRRYAIELQMLTQEAKWIRIPVSGIGHSVALHPVAIASRKRRVLGKGNQVGDS